MAQPLLQKSLLLDSGLSGYDVEVALLVPYIPNFYGLLILFPFIALEVRDRR